MKIDSGKKNVLYKVQLDTDTKPEDDEIYHRHLNDYIYVLPEKTINIVLRIDSEKKKGFQYILQSITYLKSREILPK